MAASSQQGTYLGTTLVGFTAFTAGLYVGGALGVVVAILGLLLLVISAVGFYRIKQFETMT
ncbi:MAG: hypothetical protein DMG06_24750 [Acidobacteria bacterium]|nr:MAG: hypothetical protein DMG06_24750 [Acidobacteriota bacterium]